MAEIAPFSSPLTASKIRRQPNIRGWLTFKTFSSAVGLLCMAVIVCWVLFFNALRGEWAINAQYNYGYVVPLLGLALLWRRWPDRPIASSPSGIRLAFLIGAGLLFLFLPFHVILEA